MANPVTDFLSQIFGGGGDQGAAPPPPVPDMTGMGGATTPDDPPEEKAKDRQYLLNDGVPPEAVDRIMALPPEDRRKVLTTYLLKSGALKPKKTGTTIDREALVRQYPQLRGKIEGLPDSVVGNIASSIAAQSLKPAPAPKRTIDRSQLPPQFAPYAAGMTDAEISKRMGKLMDAQGAAGGQNGVTFKDRPNAPRLKILQDEAFMRSGLKSGDTVCIRIP